MSVLRSRVALAAAVLLAVTACSGPADPGPLDGDAVLQGGVLQVHGDGGPDDIVVSRSAAGVQVERGGERALFTDPVTAIRVSVGAGDNVVRYDQTVVADLELEIVSGDGDDQVIASFAPAGSGNEMSLAVDVQTGPGSDRLELRWDGGAVPALNPYITLTGETQGEVQALPEVEDEVLVAFESGDPNRPVVIGGLWNGSSSPGSGSGVDTRGLSLELDFRAGRADAAMAIVGGTGPDQVQLDLDYSGVTLQDGRISLDTDLGEGDNSVDKYIITSVTHTFVDTNVTAGHGNNVVQLEDVLGGDGERTYAIDLGDGDNQTTLRFGDGQRGRRLATGTRNVTATYRSGAGSNSVNVSSAVVEPLVSDLTIDYGAGQGDTYGRYKVKMPWETGSPDTQPAPSQIEVLLLSPMGSGLDLRVDVGDPDVDDPGAFGVVTATASQARESDLQFLHRHLSGAQEVEQEWEIQANGIATAGSGSLVVDIPPGLERLVYLQNALVLADGATMSVALQGGDGDDAVLAHLLGISGAGQFDFLADGSAGGDLLPVLTRDLDATAGVGMAFNLLGADGDDVLALARPANIAAGTPIAHAIAGGAGTDVCYASQDVSVTACERLEAIGDELLRLIEGTFGTDLADVWRR